MEQASGIEADPPTENEGLLEDIISAIKLKPNQVDSSSVKKEDKKRDDALACRDKAMTTWARNGKKSAVLSDSGDESTDSMAAKRKRKRGSDAFQYLAEKSAKDTQLRKEELELRRQELQLQAQQQKEQFTLQQEQLKQMMQTNQNTQNLVLALLEKMSK